jgi:hypothetical protein
MSLLPPPIIIPPYDHTAATAAAANATERPIELRDRYEAACKRLMDSIETLNAYTIMNIAIRVFDVWMQNDIMDLEMPTAYACLKYLPVAHPKMKDIARLGAQICCQAKHPRYTQYLHVPEEERNALIDELGDLLDSIEDEIPAFDADDWRTAAMQDRMERINDQLTEGVTFERDPDGSINLRAFAVDAENIHRSSVQSTTSARVKEIMGIPVPADMDLDAELDVLSLPTDVQNEMTLNRASALGAFGQSYTDVLRHLWAYIRDQASERKAQLVARLVQEVRDGIETCPNGKICRLANVLAGFYEFRGQAEKDREEFQRRFAGLATTGPAAAAEERAAAAEALMEEYEIPEAERGNWRGALEEQ